jgi:ribosomal protein L6P/L9E
MSRIANSPVVIPEKVEITLSVAEFWVMGRVGVI